MLYIYRIFFLKFLPWDFCFLRPKPFASYMYVYKWHSYMYMYNKICPFLFTFLLYTFAEHSRTSFISVMCCVAWSLWCLLVSNVCMIIHMVHVPCHSTENSYSVHRSRWQHIVQRQRSMRKSWGCSDSRETCSGSYWNSRNRCDHAHTDRQQLDRLLNCFEFESVHSDSA